MNQLNAYCSSGLFSLSLRFSVRTSGKPRWSRLLSMNYRCHSSIETIQLSRPSSLRDTRRSSRWIPVTLCSAHLGAVDSLSASGFHTGIVMDGDEVSRARRGCDTLLAAKVRSGSSESTAVSQRQVPRIQAVRKTLDIPQSQDLHRGPAVSPQVPTIQTTQKTCEVSQIRCLDPVSDVPAAIQCQAPSIKTGSKYLF